MYILIQGNPIGQKRARSKNFQRPYDPQKKEKLNFAMIARSQIKKEEFFEKGVPIYLEARFYFERPRSHFGTGKNSEILKKTAPEYPCTSATHDLDNLVKFIKDCLNGIAWHDDCQIVKYGDIIKGYSKIPRTEILIKRVL